MKPRILATSWHPGSANAIVPVIKRLREEGRTDVTVVGHQYSEQILKNHEISFKTLVDYGLTDVSIGSMECLLRAEQPRFVLTGTSVQDEANRDVIEQTATLAARTLGIPTLAVLDIWANYSLRFADIYTGECRKFLPDRIAIMDQYAEKDMLGEGFDRKNLVITGNPHFDSLGRKAEGFTEYEKQKVRQQIGIEKDVLFFYAATSLKNDMGNAGYWDLDNIQLIDEVLRGIQDGDKCKYGLVLKLHPIAPKKDFVEISKYIAEHPEGRIKLVTGVDPQNIILSSDLTLTSYSTLGIEAVLIGKPCISLQPNLARKDFLAVLTQNGIVDAGYTRETCKTLVRKAYTNADYRSGLTQQALRFRTDGQATERVTGLIYESLDITP